MSGVYVYGKTEIVNTGSQFGCRLGTCARDPAITFARH